MSNVSGDKQDAKLPIIWLGRGLQAIRLFFFPVVEHSRNMLLGPD